MTPYIIAYLFYVPVILIGLTQKHLHPWLIVGSVPLILLVFLRGMVGVDTPMYEQSIDLIRSVNTYTFTFEPLFEYLVLALAKIIDSSFIIIGIVMAITTLFLFVVNRRSEIHTQILALCIIPYFYLDMTMNGLRYGLAFAIVLFSVGYLAKGRKNIFVVLALVASSIQITAIVLAGLLYLLMDLRWRRVVVLIIIAIFGFVFVGDYILFKVEANRNLQVESDMAGLVPLSLSLIILGGCFFDSQMQARYKWQLLLLLVFSLASYSITRISYAGVRLQQLNLFLIFTCIICAFEIMKVKSSKILVFIMIFVCIFSSMLRLRNFYNDTDIGTAPFAPYRFYWENSE